MEIRKTHRHVMVEKTGYGEPFCKLSRDGVLMVDSNAVDFWKNSTSRSEKIQLVSKMLARFSVNVAVSPVVYDPEDFTPKFKIIIFYNNHLITLGRNIGISDFTSDYNSNRHSYDFEEEQIFHENMLYDILKETCQKTFMSHHKL